LTAVLDTIQGPSVHAIGLPLWQSSTSPIQQIINSTHGDLTHWAVPCSWASALTVGYHSSLCANGHPKKKERKNKAASKDILGTFAFSQTDEG